MSPTANPLTLLHVEDSDSDAYLFAEFVTALAPNVHVCRVADGDDALAFLHRRPPHQAAPRPDLIVLDLNLPGTDGRGVLAQIKSDPELRRIPTVILTTSNSGQDVERCYDLHVNSYHVKHGDMDAFRVSVEAIVKYWFKRTQMPGHGT